MKKKILFMAFTILSLFVCGFVCVACKNTDGKCKHSYQWSEIDEVMHAGLCSKCGDIAEESHSFTDNKCTKCGYKKSGSSNGDNSIDKYMEIFDYTSTATTLTITGLKDISVTQLQIPNIVTAIADNAFANNKSITSLIIPNSVTNIGKSALQGCTNLIDITIPFVGESKDENSNTHFGYIFGASSYKDNSKFVPSGLKEVIIGSSCTTIGDNAFYGCSSLTNIIISDSVTTIGTYAFYGCSSLTSITMPSSVTTINDYMFYGCSSLTSITIPDSVTTIDGYAFSGCSSLTNITIPDNVTTIGSAAFSSCSSLICVTIPFLGKSRNSDTYFGYIFGASSYKDNSKFVPSSLKEVVIGSSCTIIGENAFYGCKSLANVTVPDSVNIISKCAFYNCSGLTSIAIPDGVTNIDSSVFRNCSSLTSITIPYGAAIIGGYAFSGCSSLTSITVPDGVTTIGGSAFEDCSSLTSITIPNSLTNIGSEAFCGCSSLISITIPNKVTTVGNYAFKDCNLLTIYSEAIISPSNWDTDWNKSHRPVIWDTKESGITDNGIKWGLTNCDIMIISGYLGNDTHITIPDTIEGHSVTTICERAFYNCSSFTSITIPDSVDIIGKYALYGCNSLTSITIPFVGASKNNDSNTHFGYIFGAYSYSDNSNYVPSSLKEVIIRNSCTSIGQYAFYKCSSLISIIIPDSVTTIGGHAFASCYSLTNIIIPSSVMVIGRGTFNDCRSLTIIYCEVASKPNDWNSDWNFGNKPVEWGYKG